MSRRYFALAILSCLVGGVSTQARASFLSVEEYDRFHAFNLQRTRPLADEIGKFIIDPPSLSRGITQDTIRNSLRTQNCMIELAGSFSMAVADLRLISTLVGLSVKMVDAQDELFLLRFVKLYTSGFLEQMKAYRRMLNATTRKCSDDGATQAKSQEISRVYNDAETLARSLGVKVNAAIP